MPVFSTDIDITAPADVVWPVMSDVERWHEWTASIRDVKRLDPGPFGVGSRARVRQPRLLPAIFTVTSWEPNRAFEWITRSGGVRAVARHTIQPTATGSRVTLSVKFAGPLGGIAGWLAGGLTERYLQMEAEGLKRRAEAGGVPVKPV